MAGAGAENNVHDTNAKTHRGGWGPESQLTRDTVHISPVAQFQDRTLKTALSQYSLTILDRDFVGETATGIEIK